MYKKRKGQSLITALLPTIIWFGLAVTLITAFSFWTNRTLDFWMTYFKGEVVDVPFWLSVVLSIFWNGAVLIVNIISEIAKCFVM